MTHKLTIGVIVMMALMLLFAAIAAGVQMGPSTIDEEKIMAKTVVEMKCDPCDYNIDYGDTLHPDEKGGIDEGTAKLECDPCDYNIDYGPTDRPIKE